MSHNIWCDEYQSRYPEFRCSNKATFGVVYTTVDEQSKVRYACTIHVGKAARWSTKHKHPVHRRVGIVDLAEDIL